MRMSTRPAICRAVKSLPISGEMRLYRRAWGLIHLNPAPSARRASVPAPVPEKAERTLNQRIQEAFPDDTKIPGLLSIKEAGFPAGEACRLRWEDEKFNQMGRPETAIQFEIQKDFSAGPTHDYQRPGSPRCVGEQAHGILPASMGDAGGTLRFGGSLRQTCGEQSTYCFLQG